MERPAQLPEGAADGLVAQSGALAELALRERAGRIVEQLHDPGSGVAVGFGLRLGRGLPGAQGRAVFACRELEFDVVPGGGGAVFDAHEDLLTATADIDHAVAPCEEFPGAAQRLSCPCGAALAGVVDDQDGGFELALEAAEEGEDGRVSFFPAPN